MHWPGSKDKTNTGPQRNLKIEQHPSRGELVSFGNVSSSYYTNGTPRVIHVIVNSCICYSYIS